MPTYYETLKVASTATPDEIRSACDALYNQWRRLATHHDPDVVNQANQALTEIERVRATLTDPAKRSVYDAAIGLNGPAGGLADPEAVLRKVATPPPPRAAAIEGKPTGDSLWACPKCATENPPYTTYCLKCGTELVRTCPECAELASLTSTGLCGKCGYSYEVATERAKTLRVLNDLKSQAAAHADMVAELEKSKMDVPSSEDSGKEWGTKLLAAGGIGLALGLIAQWGGLIGFAVILLVVGGIALFSANESKDTRLARLENETAKQNEEWRAVEARRKQVQAAYEALATSKTKL